MKTTLNVWDEEYILSNISEITEDTVFVYTDEISINISLTTNLMVYVILQKNHLFKQYI